MIVRRFSKSTLIVPITMLFTPAHSQEQIVGLWGFNGCEAAENIEYQGHTLAAFLNGDAVQVITQKITPVSGTSWLFVRKDELDPAPSLMRVNDGYLEQAWPYLENESTVEIEKLHTSLSSGALSPEATPEAFEMKRGEQCTGLPLPQSLVMGEALAVLKDFDAATWDCCATDNLCPKNVFNVADVSGDGELSVAEMARLIRASVSIAAAMDDEVSQGQSVVAATSATAIAPIASAALLHSFDYDRSGSLTFDELLSERLPANFNRPEKMQLDVSGWVGAISEGAKSAAGAGAMLLYR